MSGLRLETKCLTAFAAVCLLLPHLSPPSGAAAPKTQTASARGVQLKPKEAPIEPSTTRLEGNAAVYQMRDPRLEAWRASMMYQQGAYAMAYNDFRTAADCFKQSGDAFEGSIGEGRFVAESRYAEAQARRLMNQIPQSAKLFQIAVDMFRRTDPWNPYLQAGVRTLWMMGYSDQMPKEAPISKPKPKKPLVAKITQTQVTEALKALEPKLSAIDSNMPLKAKLTKLEDGTLIASLHDNDFFNGSSKRLLPQAAACDISDKFIKGALEKSFLKMTCLEFAALGANYYTAANNYKPFTADGKPILIGASDEFWSPSANININGKSYGITMDLPGINKYSKNVMLLTDGQHVLAIDPRKLDVWKLVPIQGKKGTDDFNWWKLTHTKKTSTASAKACPLPVKTSSANP